MVCITLQRTCCPCIGACSTGHSDIGAVLADPWLGIKIPAELAYDIGAVTAQAPSGRMTACADVHSKPEALREPAG